MTVVTRLPASILRAAADVQEGGGAGGAHTRLTLALRSDCAAAAVPLGLHPRTAWLVWAGRPGGGLPPELLTASGGGGVHNGVRYVAFDGPAPAWAALRALGRASDGGNGGGLLTGVRRWWSGASTSRARAPSPFPDVVLALHDPAWLPGPRTAASLRDLAGRVRLAPVCVVGQAKEADGDAAAVAAVAALYADGWLDRAPAVVRVGSGGGGLAAGLEGVAFENLLAASGGGAAARL
jgi:hypothetical protein